MEGRHAIKSGKLLKLSEQQLVDCDTKSHGCNGGSAHRGFEYLHTHYQEFEKEYGYDAKTEKCKYSKSKGQIESISSHAVKPHSSSALKAAIAQGPTSVSVSTKGPFHGYKRGILNSKDCAASSTSHAIVAVGYGEENGKPYYIVRNSWGSSWGEKGYVRIAIVDGIGICLIQSHPYWVSPQ
jgi:hypothetical protein